MLKKGFVLTTIVLFVGASFVSCISGDFSSNMDIIVINETTSSLTTDWWQMFHHDLMHSGYTSSPAPETNLILWNYSTNGQIVSSPAIVNGKVYFGSYDCNVYCLNAITGIKIWQYYTGHQICSSPAVYEGMVYIGSNDNPGLNGTQLYCLNADTGEKIWQYTAGDNSIWGFYSSPAVVDGKVYVGCGDHKVYCLDALTGTKHWEFLTNGEVGSSPAVANGKVYVGSLGNYMYCLNASNGSQIWFYPSPYQIRTSPAVVNGKVYFGSNRMFCLDADTGDFIWDQEPDFLFSSPAVYNDKVYVCDSTKSVYCLNTTNGIPIWQYETGTGMYQFMFSSPALADGKVYVGAGDGKIYCLNAETGSKIWDYQASVYEIASSPSVAIGLVCIGESSGKMYCFGIPNNPPNKPNIYGPDNGTINVEYMFCTDTITDPEGDSLFCFWDWDDGNVSGWLGPFASGQTICASHSWTEPGVYCIRLKLKDTYGMESESDPFCITIVDNHPPNKPEITGPIVIRPGPHEWKFKAVDPDGDNIYYEIDWADGIVEKWVGPYSSGEEVTRSHTYSVKMVVRIKARAQDEHGAIGDWGILTITIPRTVPFNYMFLKFLERFPHAFPIMRHIIRV